MKKPDVVIVSLDAHRRNQLVIHNREMPDQRATFAMDLIRGSMMVAIPDGKDNTGANTFRAMTEEEIVERCLTVTDKAFEAFRARDWMIDYPAYDEIEKVQTDTAPEPAGFK